MEPANIAAPKTDVLSFIFSGADASDETKVLINSSDPTRGLSINEARALVRGLVSGLKANGLQDGDVVAIHAFNSILYPVIALGIIGAGGIYAGSNPAYTAEELTHHFETANARFIITEQELVPKIGSAIVSYGIAGSNVFVLDRAADSDENGFRGFDELLQHGEKAWTTFDNPDMAEKTPAGLFSTSGTTGRPKLAMRTHMNFINESVVLADGAKKPYHVKRLISLPLFHAFAAPVGMIGPLRDCIPTYIMRRFAMADYLSLIGQHGITESIAAPPMILGFLSLSPEKRANLRMLETMTCAGAALASSVQLKASHLLSPTGRLVQCWGMTEAGWITTFKYPEDDQTGSVGRPLPNTEIKLIDEDGRFIDAGSNATGEIVVRSPSVMMGYLGNSTATQESKHDSTWLRTGDIGCIRDGKVYLTDRVKDLIKVKGWQVAPVEIEDVLLSHDQIQDAAVFGATGPDNMSEMVYVNVIRVADATIQSADVKAFLLQHLARYKVQDAVISFCDSIPRNPSGKILKRLLKDQVKKEQEEAKNAQEQSEQQRRAPEDAARGDSLLTWFTSGKTACNVQ